MCDLHVHYLKLHQIMEVVKVKKDSTRCNNFASDGLHVSLHKYQVCHDKKSKSKIPTHDINLKMSQMYERCL